MKTKVKLSNGKFKTVVGYPKVTETLVLYIVPSKEENNPDEAVFAFGPGKWNYYYAVPE